VRAVAEDKPVIVVVGEGRESGTADRCVMNLALNVMAETVGDALTKVSGLANQVVEKLKERGVTDEHAHTQNLTVQDLFDQTKQKVTARIASYALTVDVPPDDVGPHLSALTEVAGDSLQVRGLLLALSEAESLRVTARRRAVEDARSRAEQLAEAAHLRLGPILSMEEGVTGMSPFRTWGKLAATPSAPSLPVEPGSLSTTVHVTVTFQLES